MTENPGRDAAALRDMEASKREFQVRCSHIELELSGNGDAITCSACGKIWRFMLDRGYSNRKKVFAAEK